MHAYLENLTLHHIARPTQPRALCFHLTQSHKSLIPQCRVGMISSSSVFERLISVSLPHWTILCVIVFSWMIIPPEQEAANSPKDVYYSAYV